MKAKLFAVGCLVLSLAACGSDPEKPQPTADIPPPPAPAAEAPKSGGGMFGWLGGGSASKPDDRKGVAVNAYLWRASLDALSFMPMEQTDPFGGVIKTDWYVPPSTPNERLKVSVFILDSRLRAEAVRVSIFKQAKKPAGEWAEATVDPDTVTKLENVILDKARALKIQDE
ncbi:MAG: DUF3576 domain-containing protein [Micropepsaceae bacterium]